MTIFEQINDDIKTAMKAREKEKLEALRNIKKVMLEAKTSKGAGAELTDEEALKIISKLAKQGSDSAVIYKEQGRQELHDQEMVQVAVYESYLPAKMSEEELTFVVKAIIEKTGASSMKDMGKVMGLASKELAGKADGKEIADKVKRLLQ
ncbi:GatB/YqeY domain-containing protein [Maribellus maritimus]|uniref:GatB/YqeY domain-containing protein n=1 Tax=Maribellus maritimus TaxID=2870838 RepID=UPI001EEAAC19|nr:GatB/YqeY domain-containing protein [Maribellus maritimus]MCG6187906.1 GatB/YqeY domain-containing protein [Maribellus maritimus]